MKQRYIIHRLLFANFIVGLTACASGGANVVFHTFEFDAYRDSPDIEVLDYQYGDQRTTGFMPERERVSLGQSFNSGGLSGYFPRGDSLYVKWRIKATGKVLDDRVDLRHRLPKDMVNLAIHFVCNDRQLYVFVKWPWDKQPWTREPPVERYMPVPSGIRNFEGNKIQQIYPDPVEK
jgi:hypothetical protein